jgi:hypothetical protein
VIVAFELQPKAAPGSSAAEENVFGVEIRGYFWFGGDR